MKTFYIDGRPVTRFRFSNVYYLYIDNKGRTVHCHEISPKPQPLEESCNPVTTVHTPHGDLSLRDAMLTLSSLDSLIGLEVTVQMPRIN